VQELRALPPGLARSLASRRPALLAASLGSCNALRRSPARTGSIAALLIGACAAVLGFPAIGAVLAWFAAHGVLTGTISAGLFALPLMRRKSRLLASTSASWLAALPVSAPLSPRALGALLRLLPLLALAGLAWAGGRIEAAAAAHLIGAAALGALAGVAVGAIVSRALGLGAPGSQYASLRRARARWAEAPSLRPLSYWPVARGRIFSRPKSLARVALLVALCLPLGTSGELALVVLAACLAAYGLVLLSLAAARVAFEAARWLAPTGVDRRRFALALEWRALLKQMVGCLLMVLLARLIGLPWAFRLGIPVCAAILLASWASTAVCCALACRRAGLGAAIRGP
jgi:hypothetical protein